MIDLEEKNKTNLNQLLCVAISSWCSYKFSVYNFVKWIFYWTLHNKIFNFQVHVLFYTVTQKMMPDHVNKLLDIGSKPTEIYNKETWVECRRKGFINFHVIFDICESTVLKVENCLNGSGLWRHHQRFLQLIKTVCIYMYYHKYWITRQLR